MEVFYGVAREHQEIIAKVLGYTSIGCWLCAQFPQVVKNYQLQSCEGLALPFLINWLCGDLTNLLGCILTHQLPFQTYLAAYFCIVDFTLCAQYYYYREPPQIYDLPTAHVHTRALSTTAINQLPTSSSTATLRPAHYRTLSTLSPGPSNAPLDRRDSSYAAIYEAALDVARAAERVNFKRSQSHSRIRGYPDQAEGMMESFHSEMSAALSAEDMKAMSMSVPALDTRGRTRARALALTPPTEAAEGGGDGRVEMSERRSKSRSISMIRGSGGRGKGRRAAGVAFMSFCFLVRFASPSTGHLSTMTGHVLPRSSSPLDSTTAAWLLLPHMDQPPDYQRIIGRISAWTCTTLYLTSRLPQIWKNFERKSVSGLSILLFIFAFLGNLLYTISILLDPANASDDSGEPYLLEALPYLLGSGGTLLFDMTIVLQAWLYGDAPPRTRPRKFVRRLRRLVGRPDPSSTLVPAPAPSSSATGERQPLLAETKLGSTRQVDTPDRSQSPEVRRDTTGSATAHRQSLSKPPRIRSVEEVSEVNE